MQYRVCLSTLNKSRDLKGQRSTEPVERKETRASGTVGHLLYRPFHIEAASRSSLLLSGRHDLISSSLVDEKMAWVWGMGRVTQCV